MPDIKLHVYAIFACIVLGSGGLFAAPPESQQTDAAFFVAASSVDPDFPSGLEHKHKPESHQSRTPTENRKKEPAQRKQSHNTKPSGPAERKYEASPYSTADPDWPKKLCSQPRKTDEQRSSPDADASNRDASSVDPDWPNKAH